MIDHTMDELNLLLVQARLRWRNPADNRVHLQALLTIQHKQFWFVIISCSLI